MQMPEEPQPSAQLQTDMDALSVRSAPGHRRLQVAVIRFEPTQALTLCGAAEPPGGLFHYSHEVESVLSVQPEAQLGSPLLLCELAEALQQPIAHGLPFILIRL